MLNLVSILIAIFEHLGCLFGSLLALFWEPLGGLGASLGRQVGAKGGPKRMQKGLGVKVAPSRLWDVIFKDLGRSGTSLGRSWAPLGHFWGVQN